jgi:hypothetical protein
MANSVDVCGKRQIYNRPTENKEGDEMSWIRQTIDFYRGLNRSKEQSSIDMAASSKMDSKHDLSQSNETLSAEDIEYRRWLSEFEQSLKEQGLSSLSPEQQGNRLLRLTKARALRRLLDKQNTKHESAA